MRRLGQILLFLTLYSFLPCFAHQLGHIVEKYKSIETFKANFKQTVFLANLDEERDFSGSFFYKKGKGFLWMYDSPKKRYFLFDGTYLYQYDEDKPFIRKERVDSTGTRSVFLDLINDMGNLDRHFFVKERSIEGAKEVIYLEPKNGGMIKSVRIWFSRELKLERIEIVEKGGNRNVLSFSQVVLNGEIEDKKFQFKKEKGKEVIVR